MSQTDESAPIGLDGTLPERGPLRAFKPPPLRAGEVHVWFTAGGSAASFQDLLDEPERARAARFVFPQHRARFTVAHGVLRCLLAAYMGHAPQALRFAAAAHGKPALADPQGLTFSLSHSADGVAVAVAADLDVGIDIELPHAMNARDGFVVRFFSAAENQDYFALDPAQRDDAFFRLWTRKEAFLKGIGLGLSRALDSFTVGIGIPVEIDPPDTWSLRHIAPGGGFVGALAARHPSPVLRGGRLRLDQPGVDPGAPPRI